MKDYVRDDHNVFAESEQCVHARLTVPVVPEIAVDCEQSGDDVAAGTIVSHLFAVPQPLLSQYDEHVDERGQNEHRKEFGVNCCKQDVQISSDVLRNKKIGIKKGCSYESSQRTI